MHRTADASIGLPHPHFLLFADIVAFAFLLGLQPVCCTSQRCADTDWTPLTISHLVELSGSDEAADSRSDVFADELADTADGFPNRVIH